MATRQALHMNVKMKKLVAGPPSRLFSVQPPPARMRALPTPHQHTRRPWPVKRVTAAPRPRAIQAVQTRLRHRRTIRADPVDRRQTTAGLTTTAAPFRGRAEETLGHAMRGFHLNFRD